MPKNTTKKNIKGTKSKAPKKVEAKKVQVKKVETKKAPVKKVKTKKLEVKKSFNEMKGKAKVIVDKAMSNVPFVCALCVAILLLAGLILALCTKRVPLTSDGKEIIATLKGKEITADELYVSLKDTYGTDALVNIIDTYITDKEVTIKDEDKEYVQEVVDYYKEYAEYYKTDFATFLASYVGLTGIETEEEFYDYVLQDYKKSLALTKYIGDNAKEEDLKKYYKENYTDKLTVKHILIEIDAEAKDKTKADKEAYDKAMDIIEKLNETSAKKLDSKFEKLAEENSDDTATYSKGGLIENFSKKDVVAGFYEASLKLEDGKYTKEPVKTTYGYHIILKVSSTPVEKYKDIKDDVIKTYVESLLASDASLYAKKWDELRSMYKLSIKDDVIKSLYIETLENATKTEE